MNAERIARIVRQFPENGMKLLLEDPGNVRELLSLTRSTLLPHIDFAGMTVEQTTFVARDYRHVESDVVLRAPFRRGKQRKVITIYVLIEHQSEPDPLMRLRMLEYIVQIYKAQLRTWGQSHSSLRGFLLQPVLPVVFYTGTRRWDALPTLTEVMEQGQLFLDVTPRLDPLFLNLQDLAADRLETPKGAFSWVLRLFQQSDASEQDFGDLLQRVTRQLETIPVGEALRWRLLLSYIQALVYHRRAPQEHAELYELIEESVRTEEHRKEVRTVKKTIADMFREEGAVECLRSTLLELLQERFGEVPEELTARVETSKSLKQLRTWMRRFATARTIADVQIPPLK